MKKIINKRIFTASAIALVFMIVVVFLVQTNLMQKNACATLTARIDDVTQKLETNDAELEELTSQLGSDFIAKADAFAEMIALDPTIIEDSAKLSEIAGMLDVDELHVTDDKGIIQWGTVPDYFGFDFASSDQAKEFMPILDDPSIKIAQDPQPNGAEGKLFQYVSVARIDQTGIVQIGVTPDRLQAQVEKNSIGSVLEDFTVGSKGYVFAVSKEDNTLAYYPDESLIGLTTKEAGITDKLLNAKSGKMVSQKIKGELIYCCVGENDQYKIITALPSSEVYSGSVSLVFFFAGATIIMLIIIILLINSMLQKVIINGINKILSTMETISSGDLDAEVDVKTCPEYEKLSNGINSMLANIKSNMDKTVKLTDEQQHLFEEISSISTDISVQSAEMKNVASKISAGSSVQAATIEELSASFTTISKQIKDSAESAKNASNISNEAAQYLNAGAEKLGEMQKAMQKIEESSNKISNIVRTIDDIAFQTNILALNAAVEAARAGQHGKGFAVVADEVRTLANKSAESTKGTAALIEETRQSVEYGTRIADETAESIRSMIQEVTESNKLIDGIAVAADEQSVAFTQISQSMLEISNVVQQNAEISSDAEMTAGKLEEQVQSLKALFE
ncbi:MAG: methyl-accepting chemotaxis protein [Oscillospiraceae bacterium]|nr:methyl-accepting chemotaxis protein [Oscillospiraceae bacterium]